MITHHIQVYQSIERDRDEIKQQKRNAKDVEIERRLLASDMNNKLTHGNVIDSTKTTVKLSKFLRLRFPLLLLLLLAEVVCVDDVDGSSLAKRFRSTNKTTWLDLLLAMAMSLCLGQNCWKFPK